VWVLPGIGLQRTSANFDDTYERSSQPLRLPRVAAENRHIPRSRNVEAWKKVDITPDLVMERRYPCLCHMFVRNLATSTLFDIPASQYCSSKRRVSSTNRSTLLRPATLTTQILSDGGQCPVISDSKHACLTIDIGCVCDYTENGIQDFRLIF
jgi:hypothetical protein